MSNDSERLLYVISAKREITWSHFKEIFADLWTRGDHSDELSMDGLPDRRRDTARALDALGHCEFWFGENDSKVFVAPTVLGRLPRVGLPQAVMAGARVPKTLEVLSEQCRQFGGHVKVDVQNEDDGFVLVPSRVVVETESLSQLHEISASLGIFFAEEPPAWTLLHFSGSLSDYLATLSWSTAAELNWVRKDFDTSSLQFGSRRREGEPVRLSAYVNRIRRSRIHFLWKDGRCARVDRDWGRYAAMEAAGVNVLFYDAQRFLMAVPASVPLPRLLARTLALCSGLPPPFVPGHVVPCPNSESRGFNLFCDIPPQIAEQVSTKLGQSLLPYSLAVAMRGGGE